MLVITRRAEESFTIGDEIKVEILQIKGGATLVGITAPQNLAIKRDNMKKGIINESTEQAEQARDGNLIKGRLI